VVPEAYYQLSEVRRQVRQARVMIRPNALMSAAADFEWGEKEILEALEALRPEHFHKTEDHTTFPGVKMDYYKADDLEGEPVYLHFYIDDEAGVLVLSSFKKL
jgi:Motility quorum-sensing regulator, toxin of MqsA